MTTITSQQIYARSAGISNNNAPFFPDPPRDPTPYDTNYPIGKFWINVNDKTLFYLNSQTTINGLLQSVWIQITEGTGNLDELTPDIGGVVTPVGGNINVLGGSTGTAIQTSNGGAAVLKVGVLVDGTTITINSSNQLQANNAGEEWSVVTTNTTVADSNGYFANGGASPPLNFSLYSPSQVGDTFEVCAMSNGGWKIVQLAGQSISLDGLSTTIGTGGSIESTCQSLSEAGDWIILTCNVATPGAERWIASMKMGVATVS